MFRSKQIYDFQNVCSLRLSGSVEAERASREQPVATLGAPPQLSPLSFAGEHLSGCSSSKLRGLKRKWIRCSAQATVPASEEVHCQKLNLCVFQLEVGLNDESLLIIEATLQKFFGFVCFTVCLEIFKQEKQSCVLPTPS